MYCNLIENEALQNSITVTKCINNNSREIDNTNQWQLHFGEYS